MFTSIEHFLQAWEFEMKHDLSGLAPFYSFKLRI